MKPGEDDEPIMWFHNILPRIKEKYPEIPVYEVSEGSVQFERTAAPTDLAKEFAWKIPRSRELRFSKGTMTATANIPKGADPRKRHTGEAPICISASRLLPDWILLRCSASRDLEKSFTCRLIGGTRC